MRRTAVAGLLVVAGAFFFSRWQITKANRVRDEAQTAAIVAASASLDAIALRAQAQLAAGKAEHGAWIAERRTDLSRADTQVARWLEADARAAATRQQEIAAAMRLASDSATLFRQQPHHLERAVRLAAEAVTRLDRQGVRELAADLALRESLPLLPAIEIPGKPLPGSGEPLASPDGRWIANTGPGGVVLCDTNDGECRTIDQTRGSWNAIAFSRDASLLAAAADAKVHVFETATRRLRAEPWSASADVQRLAFGSGTILAVAAGETFEIRDAVSGEALAQPRTVEDDIRWLELSHDPESEVLLTSFGKCALAWKWRTSEPAAALPTKGPVLLATFAPDDRTVATIDLEQGLVVSKWSWPDASESWTAGLPPPLHSARFSNDGKRIAVSRFRGYGVHVYDVAERAAPVAVLDVPGRWLAFSRDGSQLATGARYGASVWRVDGGGELARAPHAETPSVAFRGDGAVVSFDRGRELKVWRPNTVFRGEMRVAVNSRPLAAALEPRTNRLLLTTRRQPDVSAPVYRVDHDGTAQPCSSFGHESISSIVFTPQGFLISGSMSGEVLLWKSWCEASREMPIEIAKNNQPIDAIAVRGSRLVFASGDTLTMIDDWHGTARRSFTVPDAGRSRSIALAANGDVIAGGFSGAVRVWPWRGARPVAEHVPGGGITQIVAEGDFVASGGNAGATIWNRRTGAVHRLPHDTLVWSVALDPSGRYLMTAGADQMAHVWADWDRETAEEIARVALSMNAKRNETDGVQLAAFSDDGARITVVTNRQNPYVFITPWRAPEMIDAARRSLLAARALPFPQ